MFRQQTACIESITFLQKHNANLQNVYLDQNVTTRSGNFVFIFHLKPHIFLPPKHLPGNTDLSKNPEFGWRTAQYSPALKGSVHSV